MHHVAYFSWTPEEVYEVVDRFDDAGIEIAQSGTLEGTEFWYFDTRDLLDGLFFETAIRRNVEERAWNLFPPGADADESVR
jgi:hypothetical protein